MNQPVDPGDLIALLQSVREKEDGAFEKLLVRYQPLLVKTASSFAGNGDVMMLEARLALYRAAFAYREQSGLTFGLFAKICITNALLSLQRQEKRWSELLAKLSEEPPETVDPVDWVIYSETVKDFYRLSTELLSPLELKTVTLRVNGYSNREIADVLHKSEKSVANALGRAVKKIRERGSDSFT